MIVLKERGVGSFAILLSSHLAQVFVLASCGLVFAVMPCQLLNFAANDKQLSLENAKLAHKLRRPRLQ